MIGTEVTGLTVTMYEGGQGDTLLFGACFGLTALRRCGRLLKGPFRQGPDFLGERGELCRNF